jgi:serine/threonine-protein kinase RsbW
VDSNALHILNLQPELHRDFFRNVQLPDDIAVKRHTSYKRFLKGIQAAGIPAPRLLLFIPIETWDIARTREIRLAQCDAPIYIVAERFSEKDYLSYLTLGISGMYHPPFGLVDLELILKGRRMNGIPFPRNTELIREGQVRLDFLVPSKLSRIVGVNRLVSFLTTEFGFPLEDCTVNLPLVMDEALSNAIIHGNKRNENLKVHVRIYISSRRIVIQVEDQGEGFPTEGIDDPRRWKNIYKGSGRGIFLVKELMDNVRFEKGGRVIEMDKVNPLGADGHNDAPS